MDDYPLIRFGWGGCGNLVNFAIQSNNDECYQQVVSYYTNLQPTKSWTNQEWKPRRRWGMNLTHEFGEDGVALAWDNSWDTTLHYLIKNPELNHLAGLTGKATMVERVAAVLDFNQTLETQLRSRSHISLGQALSNSDAFYQACCNVQTGLDRIRIERIYKLWKISTRNCYEQHAPTALKYLAQLPTQALDYEPFTIYNVLYENTDIRKPSLGS